jgi:hypothetical protein
MKYYNYFQWIRTRKYHLLKLILKICHGNKALTQLRKLTHTKKYYIFRYGEKLGTERYDETLRITKLKGTKQFYIEKYGEDIGIKKYLEKNKKLSVSYKALKNNGHTDEEIKQIRKKHADGSKHTRETYIKKYGEKEGQEKYKIWMTQQRVSVRSVKELIERKGLTKEQAEIYVSKLQTRDLNFFIKKYGIEIGTLKFQHCCNERRYKNSLQFYKEKYGTEEGTRKYKDRIKRQTSHHSFESFIKRFGEKEGIIKFKDLQKRKAETRMRQLSCGSKKQLNFSRLLYDKLPLDLKTQYIGTPVTKSRAIFFEKNECRLKFCVPDILIGKLIIEFDGTYWHNNSLEVMERDTFKTILLVQKGYTLIRVKEKDYDNNQEQCIINTLNQILYYENQKSNKGE